MEILISALIWIGKILIAAMALIGVALAAWPAWAAFTRANVKHVDDQLDQRGLLGGFGALEDFSRVVAQLARAHR